MIQDFAGDSIEHVFGGFASSRMGGKEDKTGQEYAIQSGVIKHLGLSIARMYMTFGEAGRNLDWCPPNHGD